MTPAEYEKTAPMIFKSDPDFDTDMLDEDDASQIQQEAHFTAAGHLELNRQNYEAMPKKSEPLPSNSERSYLIFPAASKISSQCLNPWFYTNCLGVTDLNVLAAYLDVPENWKSRIDTAMTDQNVDFFWRDFCSVRTGAWEVPCPLPGYIPELISFVSCFRA